MTLASILFWIAVVLLVDAGIGLLGERKFHAMMPRVPIRTIAIIEACLAGILLLIYFIGI